MTDLDLAQDPQAPTGELEDLYWKHFTSTTGAKLDEVMLAIARNPNVSRALLAKLSLHTRETAKNPLVPMLILEDLQWVRRNINPAIVLAALEGQ